MIDFNNLTDAEEDELDATVLDVATGLAERANRRDWLASTSQARRAFLIDAGWTEEEIDAVLSAVEAQP